MEDQDPGWKVVCSDQVVLETRWMEVRYMPTSLRQSSTHSHLQLLAVYLAFCLTVGKWLTDVEEHATQTQKGPQPGLEPVAYYYLNSKKLGCCGNYLQIQWICKSAGTSYYPLWLCSKKLGCDLSLPNNFSALKLVLHLKHGRKFRRWQNTSTQVTLCSPDTPLLWRTHPERFPPHRQIYRKTEMTAEPLSSSSAEISAPTLKIAWTFGLSYL